MTIEMLNQGTILVSLGAEDMRRYALRLDDAVPQTALKNLLFHVGEVCGLDHRGKSYLIEALPARAGCLLIISVHAAKYRKKYRIKRTAAREICVFFDADAMLDYLRGGMRGGDRLYRYADRYILIPGSSAGDGGRARPGEYGELYPVSAAVEARICEFGTLLRQQDVQRRHIGAGAVAVRDAALRDRRL